MQTAFDKLDAQLFGGAKEFKETDLIVLHHRFMSLYGWIPLEEFRHKIPIPTFFNLCEAAEKDAKKQQVKRGKHG